MAEQQSPEKRSDRNLQGSTKTRDKKRSSRLSNVKKRNKANDRERSRMADIRGGFKLLRRHIPGKFAPTFKHLPKIQILHYAMTYISELSDILQSDEVKEVDFSGKSYPLHKTSKLPVEEMAEQFGSELTPPASGDEGENMTLRFDDISISHLQSPTNQAVEKNLEPENTDFDCVEYLQNIPGYLTPNIQFPAPADMTQTDAEFHDELEKLLTPTSTEAEKTFNLEDYLEEDICSSVTECEANDSYKLGLLVCPDFSDLLTPTECDEILGQIAQVGCC